MQQGQHGGVSLAVLVMLVRVVAGQQQEEEQGGQQQQGPLSCWSCSDNTTGQCYDLDQNNKNLSQTCNPEEVFCSVNRIWYVVEGEANETNFSLNRTCVAGCSPSCVVIGDRTKIHSCTSCCTSSLCNIGNSASAQPMASTPLVTVLVAALLVGAWLRPALPVVLFLPAG